MQPVAESTVITADMTVDNSWLTEHCSAAVAQSVLYNWSMRHNVTVILNVASTTVATAAECSVAAACHLL
jgi:hypothetical protein